MVSLMLFSFSCSNSERDKNKANDLESQGRYSEAIDYLDKAISEDPYCIDVYLDRGVDYSILGNFEKAISDYSSVIFIDSVNVLAHYNRAKNYQRVREFNHAYDDIQKAYNLTAKYKIGDVSFSIEKDNNMEKGSIMSIEDDKYAVSLYEIVFERALVYLTLDSLEKAYDDINYSINSQELFAQAHYWRGIINQKNGNTIDACNDFHTALNNGVIDAKKEIERYCGKQNFD